jgi:hypothetical protein
MIRTSSRSFTSRVINSSRAIQSDEYAGDRQRTVSLLASEFRLNDLTSQLDRWPELVRCLLDNNELSHDDRLDAVWTLMQVQLFGKLIYRNPNSVIVREQSFFQINTCFGLVLPLFHILEAEDGNRRSMTNNQIMSQCRICASVVLDVCGRQRLINIT